MTRKTIEDPEFYSMVWSENSFYDIKNEETKDVLQYFYNQSQLESTNSIFNTISSIFQLHYNLEADQLQVDSLSPAF